MDYGNKFALCGCYLPENTESSREEISKLDGDQNSLFKVKLIPFFEGNILFNITTSGSYPQGLSRGTDSKCMHENLTLTWDII